MAIVIINPEAGGSDLGKTNNDFIEKDFNLEISKIIYDNLKKRNIETYLVRDDDVTLSNEERLNIISNLIKPNEKNILLTTSVSTGGDSGTEIIYALRNNSELANVITNEIKNNGFKVLKYYQLRDPDDTSKDFYEIIEKTNNAESLIIKLGYIDNDYDREYLINNIEKLGQAISDGIYNYIAEENIYIVKSGDSLYKIANNFDVTVDELKEANNLTNNNLQIGQRLIIPKKQESVTSPNEYLNYTVKSGDSLYKIANSYDTTVNTLIEINNLNSNILQIGQVLKIPVSVTDETVDYFTYTVKSGDSLYKIANSYDTSVNEIKNLNDLESNLLQIGQVLKIPNNLKSENNEQLEYIVKSGDSLYKIANSYNTSVNEIKNLNNLESNLLQIGQVLKIPVSKEEIISYITYTVKSGDSLYKIANSYNTSVNEIKNLNDLESNLLQIGQVLKIPSN